MFAALPASILSRSDINDNAKIVYAALLMRLGGKTKCWPTQETIAEDTGRAVRSVKRALADLRAAKLVEVKQRKHQSAVYTVIVPEQRVSQEGPNLAPQENKKGQIWSQEGPNLAHRIEKEYKTKNPPQTPPPDTTARERERQALELVEAWDKQFPQTTPGCNRLQDQSALIRLLSDHGKTPDDIRGYINHLADTNGVQFCLRPTKLMQHQGGNGPYGFVALDVKIANATKGDTPRLANGNPDPKKIDLMAPRFDPRFFPQRQ